MRGLASRQNFYTHRHAISPPCKQNCTLSMPSPAPRSAATRPVSVSRMVRPMRRGCSRWQLELKHSETAFLFPEGSNWNLRWFTPEKEVELCGHATLAAAFVLWETGRVSQKKPIAFTTLSGTLAIWQDEDWISMDFPAEPAATSMPVPGLGQALGVEPLYTGRNGLIS